MAPKNNMEANHPSSDLLRTNPSFDLLNNTITGLDQPKLQPMRSAACDAIEAVKSWYRNPFDERISTFTALFVSSILGYTICMY
uniref:Uncharacterized protein n=1 Tax=Lepeophtheirus salmonis TaxID=72036 RepID=A0A0K2V0Z5_LEPSM